MTKLPNILFPLTLLALACAPEGGSGAADETGSSGGEENEPGSTSAEGSTTGGADETEIGFRTSEVYDPATRALRTVADTMLVARIFAAKRRPAFDPLIVHVATPDDWPRVASAMPPQALALQSASSPRLWTLPSLTMSGAQSELSERHACWKDGNGTAQLARESITLRIQLNL